MTYPFRLDDLPPPPRGRIGWPWTEAPAPLPPRAPNGKAWPTISIITPSYQQGMFVEETIRSVLLQGYPRLQYLLIDGGSTDATQSVLARYAPYLDVCISEPDRGQSHALNKGFARAQGEVVGWLNSDDIYTPGALAYVGAAAASHPGEVIGGDMFWYDQDKQTTTRYSGAGLSFAVLMRFWRGQSHLQPSTFWPLRLHEQVGGIDETLRYAMDYDLFCRLLRAAPYHHVPEALSQFRLHNVSKTGLSGALFTLESHAVAQRYWDSSFTAADRREAHAQVARYLTRQSVRVALGGNLRRAGSMFGKAVRFNPLAAVHEPWTMSYSYLRRRGRALRGVPS